MKIGILTIHSAHNYGAVLQAFALNYYLRNKPDSSENTVELIDYRPDSLNQIPKFHFYKNLVSNLIEFERLVLLPKTKRSYKAFDDFIRKADTLSECCTEKSELDDIVKDYDIIIAGSDQIWNYTITSYDKSFFLGFESFNGKKISYASSFGGFKFNEKQTEEVKNYLRDFDRLSCRETDGCDYISEITSRECVNVCDPTLLLKSEDYLSLLETNKIRKKIKSLISQDYLLLYNIVPDDEMYRFAKEFAQKNKLKVFHIYSTLRKKNCVDRIINDASPQEFISLFDNAKYVVTNSFHGTSFSIIFKKDFFVINPTKKNRIVTLLDKVNLLERIIDTKELSVDEISKMKIDYKAVSEKLEVFTENSKKYLIESLSE